MVRLLVLLKSGRCIFSAWTLHFLFRCQFSENMFSQWHIYFNHEGHNAICNLDLLHTFVFLVHLSLRLKCTIVIMRCPLLTLHIFDFSSELRLTELNKTWQEARTQHALPSLCFSGQSEKQDGPPLGLWLAETFSTSPLKPLNRMKWNLIASKISMSSNKFVFFWSIRKTRWLPLPLIGWDIFDFYSQTTEQNSTKLDRKQDLNVLYQVCVFQAQSEKQDVRPCLWLVETCSTSSTKPLNGIQRNLKWSKISISST